MQGPAAPAGQPAVVMAGIYGRNGDRGGRGPTGPPGGPGPEGPTGASIIGHTGIMGIGGLTGAAKKSRENWVSQLQSRGSKWVGILVSGNMVAKTRFAPVEF